MSAKFLNGTQINDHLERLILEAKDHLFLICPFIKLHTKIKRELKAKRNDPHLQIVLLFGKNDGNWDQSFSMMDFEFFREFPNITIHYEPNLHAKYYSNESEAIITSMNLYDYSHNSNIESGVLISANLMSILTPGNDDADLNAHKYFERVIDNSELLFSREPNFKKNIFDLQSEYIDSTVNVDKLSEKYQLKLVTRVGYKSFEDKPLEQESQKFRTGYCIRTGLQIPFDLDKPYCDRAYNSWSKWRNEDYQEKFCHFSGEESSGFTSFAKPILGKYWKEAKKIFAL